MLTTYKVDMAMALEHMAAREGLSVHQFKEATVAMLTTYKVDMAMALEHIWQQGRGYQYTSSKKQQKRERTYHDDEGHLTRVTTSMRISNLNA